MHNIWAYAQDLGSTSDLDNNFNSIHNFFLIHLHTKIVHALSVYSWSGYTRLGILLRLVALVRTRPQIVATPGP